MKRKTHGDLEGKFERLEGLLEEEELDRERKKEEEEVRRKEEQRKINMEKLLYGEERREQRKRDKKRHKRLYRKIDRWANDFSSSDQFNDAFNFLAHYYDYSHPEGVEIYIGSWGHKESMVDEPACWSKITLLKGGGLKYVAGYKFFGASTRFFVGERNGKKLNVGYLEKLYKHIKTGEVYDHIVKYLEDFKQRQ